MLCKWRVRDERARKRSVPSNSKSKEEESAAFLTAFFPWSGIWGFGRLLFTGTFSCASGNWNCRRPCTLGACSVGRGGTICVTETKSWDEHEPPVQGQSQLEPTALQRHWFRAWLGFINSAASSENRPKQTWRLQQGDSCLIVNWSRARWRKGEESTQESWMDTKAPSVHNSDQSWTETISLTQETSCKTSKKTTAPRLHRLQLFHLKSFWGR